MVASVLRCAGYRVGVYTSPHLHHISERISTDAGSHIRPEAFDELVSDEWSVMAAYYWSVSQ